MKELTVRQVAQLKRTSQNVYPLVNQKNKLYAKIEELNNELESVNAQIDAWESATKAMTGGFTSEDLIVRNVVCAVNEDGTTKVDKNGQPVKVTKYEPNPSTLVYNSDKNVYEIHSVVQDVDFENVDEEAKVEETADNEFNPAEVNTLTL